MVLSLGPAALDIKFIKRDAAGNDLITINVLGENKGSQGVCLLSGYSGLYHAPRTHVKEAWAYQEGITLSDFPRVDERIIEMRLSTQAYTASAWETIDAQLWEVLRFEEDAYLRVKAQNSTWRELKVRLNTKPVDVFQYTPGAMKHMVWEVTLIAPDPWWYSETLTSSWTRGAAVANGSGWYGGIVMIQNPADQQCWLEWSNDEIEVAETWALPDALALYPPTHPTYPNQNILHTLPQLGVGKEFLVQTHPLEETLLVMDDGQDWAKMRAEEFVYPVKRRTLPMAAPVALKGGTVNSKIEVHMTQKWDRPWGGE